MSNLDKVLRKLVESKQENNSRGSKTTIVIVDSKSDQNTVTAEEKGYDARKKVWNKVTHWGRYFKIASCHYAYSAEVTDQKEAIEMMEYDCDVTDNLN